MTGDKPTSGYARRCSGVAPPARASRAERRGSRCRPTGRRPSVEQQDHDPASLLDLYRRLIRLRLDHSALGVGEYLPLTAGNPAVAAYLRRDRDRVVLVVANVGATAAEKVTLTSPDAALSPGTYAAARLLQSAPPQASWLLRMAGIRGYVPVTTLAPLETWILELSKTP